MMKVIRYPERAEWTSLLERPHIDMTALYATVNTVLTDVRTRGDRAVLDYEEKFDRVSLSSLQVTEAEMEAAEQLVPEELKDALRQAERNIATFHEAQRFQGKKIETAPGVVCWLKAEREARGAHYLLEVDGGVDNATAPQCVEAGADILVAGSAVFGAADPAAAVQHLVSL